MYGTYAYYVSGFGEPVKGCGIVRGKSANKGFSLVELIIVIAIMAAFIGLMAPQYIRHVRKTKVTSDINNANVIVTAVNAACADETSGLVLPGAGVSKTITADDIPNVSTFPKSETDSSYQWDVIINQNGVYRIDLGGYEIWPDPGDALNGFKTHNL